MARCARSLRSRGFVWGEYRDFGSETYIFITTLILAFFEIGEILLLSQK